jgi:hypothetical protein
MRATIRWAIGGRLKRTSATSWWEEGSVVWAVCGRHLGARGAGSLDSCIPLVADYRSFLEGEER